MPTGLSKGDSPPIEIEGRWQTALMGKKFIHRSPATDENRWLRLRNRLSPIPFPTVNDRARGINPRWGYGVHQLAEGQPAGNENRGYNIKVHLRGLLT